MLGTKEKGMKVKENAFRELIWFEESRGVGNQVKQNIITNFD